ncbi:MAG TPA: hypothetical protein PLC01_02485, partial [Methylotenera sp.]|nr:hypothetical protein [Methylotenera sp.]
MRQFSYPNSQFTNILGGASIGWKLNVYDTGTTDYASIYSNLAQTTPTANPVIADADGFLASFYWTGTVDVVLTDKDDNLIDSANGIQDLLSTINAVVVAGNITLPFGDASGDGNTITTTLPITADFSDSGVFIVRANANNAGTINTPNLQINSYASRRIKKIGGSALVANDIVSGMNCLLVYHEAQDSYYLLNPNASYLNRDGTAKMLGAIDMDSHKITNLTNGTANGDAVNYLQLGGDAEREFLAATATTGNAVVNKTQFDAKTGLATDTVAGIVEKATQAEMNAGTADKFPSAAEIFSGFTNSSDGFKLPEFLGGWEIKTGTSTQSFGDTDVTITFTPAFASVCAFTIGIILNSSSSDTEDIWVQIQSKNASSVTFKIQGSGTITPESRTIQWFAIGK